MAFGKTFPALWSRTSLLAPPYLFTSATSRSHSCNIHMSSSSSPTGVSITGNDALLKYIGRPPSMFPVEKDKKTERRDYLLGKTARKLRSIKESAEKLQLIDTIQRLGIGYYLEEDINAALRVELSEGFSGDDNLFTTALRFRLLRHNGFRVSSDVFAKFTDGKGKFQQSLVGDVIGLLSLYEASYTGAQGETLLDEAQEFTKSNIQSRLSDLPLQLQEQVAQALEVPRHLRMARLEARLFIDQYSKQRDRDDQLLELARLDYDRVQVQHQAELAEITRWWTQLGLVEKLPFARDRPLECFLWTVGLLPESKYSSCRIELAKTIAILLVIDDIFDTYGKMEELILFTDAITRWDLEAIEGLPEYMKICYMALYNTNNDICYTVLKENGWSVLPYLKSSWVDMIQGFMAEVKWFNGGGHPNLEEYIENGVSTAGAYMALVHLFFLIGEGITEHNASLLFKPYPKLFSAAGQILRLWDDLGTAKEEQERGDLSSSVALVMKEENLLTEEKGRNRILEKIENLWKDLNGEMMFESEKRLPLAIVKVALNMARASRVVYKHEDDSYFSSVDNYVRDLFFTPTIA